MSFVAESKKELRRQLTSIRNALTEQECRTADKQILEKLISLPAIQNADLILCYASCHGEPDTWHLMHWILQQGKQLALPRCFSNQQMQFCLVSQLQNLQLGKFHIPEPVSTQIPEITGQTVCITPALAFTRRGERLGRGGGFYDRFLQKYPALYTIGICYDCMIQEELPCQSHDCCVSMVITEHKLEVVHEFKI